MKAFAHEADSVFTAMFAGRSASERLRMTCEMFDAAKKLVAAGIRHKRPDISPADLRIEIFDRIYAGDFDARTRVAIIAALRSMEI